MFLRCELSPTHGIAGGTQTQYGKAFKRDKLSECEAHLIHEPEIEIAFNEQTVATANSCRRKAQSVQLAG